jgi:hypothetical protein
MDKETRDLIKSLEKKVDTSESHLDIILKYMLDQQKKEWDKVEVDRKFDVSH